MNRILRSSSMLCLLLALAACSSTKRLGTGSAASGQAVPAAAAATDAAPLAPSRADTLLAEGDQLQAQGRCHDAVQHYGLAALEPGTKRSQALASVYQCYWQLQRPKAAAESFMLWLQHELNENRLPIRLLFQPGEARYLADPRISALYGVWLRRIADATQGVKQCLTLHGHAGPSAVEQYTAELPLRRAQAVQRQLETLAPALKDRIKSLAAAPEEPLIGSASDDLRDALDRRVEFTLRPC